MPNGEKGNQRILNKMLQFRYLDYVFTAWLGITLLIAGNCTFLVENKRIILNLLSLISFVVYNREFINFIVNPTAPLLVTKCIVAIQ